MTADPLDTDSQLPDAATPAGSHTASGIPIRNIWYMLLYAWDRHDLAGQWRSEVEAAPSIDALLASILAQLIQQRLRIGIGRDYNNHSTEIAAVRGRVLLAESMRRMSFPRGRACCSFQVFTQDVPKNRLIRGVLAKLISHGDLGAGERGRDLRAGLRRVVRDLDAVRLESPTAEGIGRELLRKHDRDYALMLTISHLILKHEMPTESTGVATSPVVDRSSLILSSIYEKFVARFYRKHLEDWAVTAQPRWRWPAGDPSAYLPTMSPDVLLEHQSGRTIVLDTKFTADVLTPGQWDTLRFKREHLFQIYAYLRSQEHRSEGFMAATGVLLYPTVRHSVSESVKLHGHPIRWETVDFARPWQEIHDRLLVITN